MPTEAEQKSSEDDTRSVEVDAGEHVRKQRTRYRFNAGESISNGVKRIVVVQIRDALSHLETRGAAIDGAIHDARVCIKKVRAVLRLVRGDLRKDTFEADNIRFRDAGRRLSAVRDSVAILEAFDNVTNDTAGIKGEEFEALRAKLIRAEKATIAEKESALSEVSAVLQEELVRIADWRIHKKGFSAVGPGLRRVYRLGRHSFNTAREHPTTENLHELRKRVKDLSYQLHVLRPVWPEILKCLSGQLGQLADLLSENHDLAVLREALSGMASNGTADGQLKAILAAVDRRRDELQVRAIPIGERVYVDKPGAFCRRVEGYWNVWRHEVE